MPASLKSGFGGFLSWWSQELRSVRRDLQRWVRQIGGSSLLLILGPKGVTGAVLQGSDFRRLGTVTLAGNHRTVRRKLAAWRRAAGGGRAPVCGVLPASSGLTRRLRFPETAEPHLPDIVRNQINRLTPFEPDQVCFDFFIVRRLPKSSEIEVLLVVAPRESVQESLQTLRGSGLPVSQLTVADNDDPAVLQTNLLPDADTGRRRDPPRVRRIQRLAVLNLALLALFCMLEVAGQGVRLLVANGQLAAAKAEAGSVAELRDTYRRLSAESRFFAGLEDKHVLSIQTVDALATALPDDTWLESLDLTAEKIEIRGVSRSPTQLIAAIDRLPLFFGTSFRSPLINKGRDGLEQFHIATIPDMTQP